MMAETISGIRTIQTSGAVFEAIVNSLPVSVFGGESGQRTGAKSGYDGSWGLNVFVIGQSGTAAGAGGGQVSGAILVSGVISGVSIPVASGGTLPVSMLSGSISGNYLNMAASGVGISHFSGALNVNISGGTISANVSGNAVDSVRYASYTLISYWSGPVAKGLIGIYHAGGAANQSGQVLDVSRLDIGIWGSGNINRVDVILGSGNISGMAGFPVRMAFGDAASVVSGWVDGATQVSGNVIQTLKTLFLEANSSGLMHTYSYNFEDTPMKHPIVRSGEELWVRLISGIGFGFISLDWSEHLP